MRIELTNDEVMGLAPYRLATLLGFMSLGSRSLATLKRKEKNQRKEQVPPGRTKKAEEKGKLEHRIELAGINPAVAGLTISRSQPFRLRRGDYPDDGYPYTSCFVSSAQFDALCFPSYHKAGGLGDLRVPPALDRPS